MAASPPSYHEHRRALIELYEKYDPAKVSRVDGMLLRFVGHEEALLKAVERKYIDGTAASSEGPSSRRASAASSLPAEVPHDMSDAPPRPQRAASPPPAAAFTATAAAGSSSPVDEAEPLDYRTRLLRLYERYAPLRVSRVDHELAKYKGREEALLQAAAARYGAGPGPGADAAVSLDSTLHSSIVMPPAPSSPHSNGGRTGLSSPRPVTPASSPAAAAAAAATAAPERPALTTPPRAASTPPAADDYRSRAVHLYRLYDPSKLHKVDAQLRRYKGREETYLRALERKLREVHTAGGAEDSVDGASLTAATPPATPRATPPADGALAVEPAVPKDGSDADDPYAAFKARLLRIYKAYAPERAHRAERQLERYPGREEEVIQAAVAKYGPEPPASPIATAAPPPPPSPPPAQPQLAPPPVTPAEPVVPSDAAPTHTDPAEDASSAPPLPPPSFTTPTTTSDAAPSAAVEAAAAAAPAAPVVPTEAPVEAPLAAPQAAPAPETGAAAAHEAAPVAAMADATRDIPKAAPPPTAPPAQATPPSAAARAAPAAPGKRAARSEAAAPVPRPALPATSAKAPAPARGRPLRSPRSPPAAASTPARRPAAPTPQRPTPSPTSTKSPRPAAAAEKPRAVVAVVLDTDAVEAALLRAVVSTALFEPSFYDFYRALGTSQGRDGETLQLRTAVTLLGAVFPDVRAASLTWAPTAEDSTQSEAEAGVSAHELRLRLVEAARQQLHASGADVTDVQVGQCVAALVRRMADFVKACREAVLRLQRQPRPLSAGFWVHRSVQPRATLQWHRCWASLSADGDAVVVCRPGTVKTDLRIPFARVSHFARDGNAAGAPPPFARHGLVLHIADAAPPLRVVLCPESGDVAARLLAAFRGWSGAPRRGDESSGAIHFASSLATTPRSARGPHGTVAEDDADQTRVWLLARSTLAYERQSWWVGGLSLQMLRDGARGPRRCAVADIASAAPELELPVAPPVRGAHGFVLCFRNSAPPLLACTESLPERTRLLERLHQGQVLLQLASSQAAPKHR